MMRKQIAKYLSRTEHVRSAAEVLAGLEHEQLQAAAALSDAAGLGYDIDVPDQEVRTDAIAAVIRGMLGGDFEDWWRQNVATEQLEKAPPKQYVGAGKGSTAWESQIEDWAGKIEAAGGEGSERHLADVACQDVYGVGLDEFEAEVLEWDRGQSAKRLIAGNFRAVRDVMQDAATELQED
ncbi:hypothetical protein [Halosimplex amylolyticum]|uniref:hypothetical protein n=1 Tax=Halosimplex amylolyticum TaxID=3396616 RepID=UPI003F545CF4